MVSGSSSTWRSVRSELRPTTRRRPSRSSTAGTTACAIAGRPFPNGHIRDQDDELRLIERVLDWDGYVRLAFDEIRLAAGGYPQVTRRLEAALADLKTVAPAERQPALDRQLRLLAAGVARAFEDEDDRRAALVADQQGIGSGTDVAIWRFSPSP